MAEWLYEAGIGETRAALIEHGRIVEMAIERDDHRHRAGTVIEARLTRRADATGRALVTLADGTGALLAPAPAGLTEGAALRVEIEREALPEAGALKPMRVRATTLPPAPGPDLIARLAATGLAVAPARPGALDDHGWSEALEEAASGIVARPDALLRIVATPAMTVIDVDGAGPPAALAIAGARLAAEAIRRFAIAGSIGIDLPTLAAKTERQAAAAALDAILPPPFERTAVNGFGFLQIIRRRVRPSLIELIAADPARAAAQALLRQAERSPGHGRLTLVAPPAIAARIAARPDWLEMLARRIGAGVALRADGARATSAGHVERDHP